MISKSQNNLKHDGSRYEVKLPFICEYKTLSDNYLLAKTRTVNVLKQLAKGNALLKNYEGIIEKAPSIPNEGCINYLSHQPSIHNDRGTKKCL